MPPRLDRAAEHGLDLTALQGREHQAARRVLAPPGGLDDVGLFGGERRRQQRFDPKHPERMARAVVAQNHPTPHLEQSVDRGCRLGEGHTPVSEDCHARSAFEIGGSQPVDDEVAQSAVRVSGRCSIEVHDETPAAGGSETERCHVVENRVSRSDCEYPVDEISVNHDPERTKTAVS